jgi:integrase
MAGVRSPEVQKPLAVQDILFINEDKQPERAARKWLIDTMGDRLLTELTPSYLEGLVKKLIQSGLSPSTVKWYLSFVSRSINRAIRDRRWTGFNPLSKMAGFQYPKINNQGERWLTPDEATNLLNALEVISPVWRDMAFVSLHTGLRLSELYKARVQDVSPETSTISVNAKSGFREVVPLTPDALEVILKRRGKPGDLVFHAPGKNYRPSPDPFSLAVKKLGFNDGVTDRRYRVWFHTLRHTFASWLAQAGVDLYTIQKMMRHSTSAMTQRYAHLNPDYMRAPLEIIRRLTNPDQTPPAPPLTPPYLEEDSEERSAGQRPLAH